MYSAFVYPATTKPWYTIVLDLVDRINTLYLPSANVFSRLTTISRNTSWLSFFLKWFPGFLTIISVVGWYTYFPVDKVGLAVSVSSRGPSSPSPSSASSSTGAAGVFPVGAEQLNSFAVWPNKEVVGCVLAKLNNPVEAVVVEGAAVTGLLNKLIWVFKLPNMLGAWGTWVARGTEGFPNIDWVADGVSVFANKPEFGLF